MVPHPHGRRVAVHVAEEALRPAVGDANRSAEPQRQQTGVHLEADVLTPAERSADPTEIQPHRFVRQTEAGGDLVTVLVQPLRRNVQFDAAAARIGDGECRFEPEERLVLHADLVGALHDDIARDGRVTVHDPLVADQIALRMDRRMAPVDRRLRVEQRVEQLVLDDDRVERSTAGLRMIRGDCGDRLAHVTHDVGREHRLILADQPIRRDARDILGRDDRLDTRDLPGRREIDRHDSCVRMGRPQRGAPQAAVGGQVRGERVCPLDLRNAVGPGRRRADRAVPGPRADRHLDVDVDRAHVFPSRRTATCCTASMMRP